MTFDRLGQTLVRRWAVVLIVWIAVTTLVTVIAPPLQSVVKTGEFAFLPSESPSLVGERLYAKAFPNDRLASTLVIVARRARDELGEADWNFIDDQLDDAARDPAQPLDLRRQLINLAEQRFGGLADADESSESTAEKPAQPATAPKTKVSRIAAVRTFRDKTVGRLLKSADNRATLILVELTSEFLDAGNQPIIEAVEQILAEPQFQRRVPTGLQLSLSGAAVVGRDMIEAERHSAQATEHLTVVLVVVLLIAIYRAPLLALIPLLTVGISVRLTMSLLQLAAQQKWMNLFSGIESYVTVLLYGAGVDYCLFLIARYKEELDAGMNYTDSLYTSVRQVGAAVTASAATVICGIGMLMFAEFGKFREAGLAISFGLVIVLLAALTFTPALLRMTGSWAFWPQLRTERPSKVEGWQPTMSIASRLSEMGWLQHSWEVIGRMLERWPGRIWLGCLFAMMPFAVIGGMFFSHLSYGLLSDLSKQSPSVLGTATVQEHFPAGTTGIITVVVQHEQVDFSQLGDADSATTGIPLIHGITKTLLERKKDLQLADVRSVSHPFGSAGEAVLEMRDPARRKVTLKRSIDHYVSRQPELAGHVTQIQCVAELDPFAKESIGHLNLLEQELRKLLPADWRANATQLKPGVRLSLIGPTASIRDLKSVTDRDQIRVDLLATIGVYVILVVLLRQPAICGYLIVSVLFSYVVTLGFTYSCFWLVDPDFAGLDWKVPMFLFTILIAVGEDYNIFLMTRIEEEQREYGPVGGVTHALARTGRIISSCGIIMAGTFASLASGYLKGMTQLGFALAAGVLLDTFVVRPILVPAYLILLHRHRFGPFSRLLGALPREPQAGDQIAGPGTDRPHPPA